MFNFLQTVIDMENIGGEKQTQVRRITIFYKAD